MSKMQVSANSPQMQCPSCLEETFVLLFCFCIGLFGPYKNYSDHREWQRCHREDTKAKRERLREYERVCEQDGVGWAEIREVL